MILGKNVRFHRKFPEKNLYLSKKSGKITVILKNFVENHRNLYEKELLISDKMG